jgi:chemotaxis protein MotB
LARRKKTVVMLNTNVWLITYIDLMTLLLSFFLLLLSMSVVDGDKKKMALKSVLGSFSLKPGGQAILRSPEGSEVTLGTHPMMQEEIDSKNLAEVAVSHSLDEDVMITKVRDRTVIMINERVLFRPGASEFEPNGIKFLSELAGILNNGPQGIELRGYAAHAETVLEAEPYKAAMVLSTGRAFAVFHFFHGQGGIPADKMVAHGFGIVPQGKNMTKKESVFHRQMDIILDYHEKIPSRIGGTKKRDTLLDFKGFFFSIPGAK